MNLKNLYSGRHGIIAIFITTGLLLFGFLRILLFTTSFMQAEILPSILLREFSLGTLLDFFSLCWLSLPLVGILILFSGERLEKTYGKVTLLATYGFLLFALIFDFIAEILFWDEFSCRFNFIAVDYLIYSRELVGLIKESYPIVSIFLAITTLVFLILWLTRKKLRKALATCTDSDRLFTGITVLIAVLGSLFIMPAIRNNFEGENRYNIEVSGNGPYNFVNAFFDNTLNFSDFYKTIDGKESFINTRRVLDIEDHSKVFDTLRTISSPKDGPPLELNVVMIMVESLSASYLGCLGNKDGLTPYLDELSEKSLFFTNCFATGTRTCRGLEALTLSIPPTPGRSIVKRPGNENMFSAGFVFSDFSYESTFIYAGFGYFDNMNYFMKNNGFNIVDRSNFASDEISFGNVWGVCDEDLLDKVLKVGDEAHSKGKLFFHHILTTSNHRPFTYPDKIDIPSGTGREGAVKYTDYAIGEFLKKAQRKPWFNNTVFIIVADHCSGSAGRSAITFEKYHIPLFMYSPAHIKPEKVNTLCSQLDTIPTLLSLLNRQYKSRFYGRNILGEGEPRAFVGNYQYLGFYRKNNMVVLGPQKKATSFKYDSKHNQSKTDELPDLTKDGISCYQTAAWMHETGTYKNEKQ